MKPLRSCIVVCILTVIATRIWGQQLLVVAKQAPVASLDSTLPTIPLEQWLVDLAGVGKSDIHWEVNDCGEGGDGRQAPTCVEAILTLTADTTAHLSLAVADINGKHVQPSIWDLAIGAGYSFTGFKTLREWAVAVRGHHR